MSKYNKNKVVLNVIANYVHKTWLNGILVFTANLLTYNYLEWKPRRNRSVWLSETLARISTGVNRYLLFIKNCPYNSQIGWELKTTKWIVFILGPSMRLIYIQLNTGVSIKLKHYKAANFQCQLRKILRLFSLMLFVVFIIIFCPLSSLSSPSWRPFQGNFCCFFIVHRQFMTKPS